MPVHFKSFDYAAYEIMLVNFSLPVLSLIRIFLYNTISFLHFKSLLTFTSMESNLRQPLLDKSACLVLESVIRLFEILICFFSYLWQQKG